MAYRMLDMWRKNQDEREPQTSQKEKKRRTWMWKEVR
jgi:hypothetical protein